MLFYLAMLQTVSPIPQFLSPPSFKETETAYLACSGMLNGFFGEGEMRHIALWRRVKHVDELNEEGEEEGETIIRKRKRVSHELTLAYGDGNIVELKETKEGDADRNKSSSMRETSHQAVQPQG